MTKRLFLDTVRHILRELFEPLDEASVDVSVLGDLFDESHLRFENLFVKLDVFNALPWPFKVQTAYIGQVHVQGMLGAVAGAPMTLRVRDVHIVLSAKNIDWTDVDGLRVANELYVALMHRLWNRHHMEGSGAKKTESVKMWLKRRIYATLDHMTIKVENIHLRIEVGKFRRYIKNSITVQVPSPPPTLETHVLGLLIPTFSVTSCESDCHILHRRDVPPALHPTTPVVSKVLMLDRITLYSAISATVPGSLSSAQWRDQFAFVWPAEAREPLLHPVRVQIKVDWAQGTDGTAKYKIRAVDIAIGHLDVTLKPAQVALLLQLCSHVDTFQRYVRYQRLKPYGTDRRPPLLSLPAFVFLPHWTPPVALDNKAHKLSARARWQFALRCVLADLYPRRDALWLSPVILMYTDLYKRQASPAYVAHITKSLVEDGKANTLPKYEPLSPHEADMLSDYIYKIALDHQLLCRAVCDRVIRQDFSRLNDAPHAPLLKRRSLLRLGSAQDLTSARGWKSLSNVEDFLFGQAALGVHVPRVKARDEPPHPVPAFFRVPRPMLHFAVASMRVSIQDETQSDVWVATTGSIAAVSIVTAEYVLLELRLGKFGLSISPSRGTLPLPVASIAYIHDEADGCIYIGVRYDPCSMTALTTKYAWKVKCMLGKIKAFLSTSDMDRMRASLMQPQGSMMSLLRCEFKHSFKRPARLGKKLPTAPATSMKDRVKQGLEALLQATTLVEVAVGGLDATMSLTALAWLQASDDISVPNGEAKERAHVFVPPHALSLSNDMDTNECVVDVLHHRVTFSGSPTGHRAAVAYLLRSMFF